MLELAILGDPTVGKSSLIDRFCNDKFSLTYTPTTRMSYTCKTISLSGKKLKLKIWDTAGQANHDSYFNTFCNERTGLVLMYSTQNPDSLQNLKLWVENLTKNFNRKIKAVVVGNKVSGEDSKISSTDLEQFVLDYNLRHFEVNIQDDFEIHIPFLELAAIMIEDDSDFGDSSAERLGPLMLSKERFDEQIQYNYYEKRPLDEVILEYKQELLDLSTNYSEFKLFITNELNQMDRKTKEHLQQIEEQHHSLLGRINEMHIGTKDYDAKSIQHTELELDFYDNNAPQTTIHIGSQGAENEIYRLKQKIESFEKRLTEGLCYMENKLKLTCSTLTKQLKHSSMAEIGSEENELVRKRSQARTTTHASQFRRSICYGHGMTKERTENNEEPGTFTEAVDNHSLTPLQTSPLIGRMNSFQAGLEKAAEGEFTPRRRVNSLDTLDLSSEGFPHVQEREHHSAELFEENYGDQEQKSEPEIHQEELEVENNCEYQYQDQDGGNYVEVKQEIVTIWNTLNQVINNTQDCFQELKSDIANTSMNREGFSHYGIAERSSLEHKGNELKIEVRKKSLSEDKDLQDIIVEVKDEVHNQIVNVQKELEEKVNYLRNNIVHQYSNFSEKMHLDQVEMKRYVDEKIDYTKLEIQGSLYPNQEEENVITSHLGLDHNEGQESQNEHPNHSISQVVEDLALLQKDKEEREKEVKIQRDLLESLKGKVSALEGSTIGNVWNTISLVASRLEKIEQALKLKKV